MKQKWSTDCKSYFKAEMKNCSMKENDKSRKSNQKSKTPDIRRRNNKRKHFRKRKHIRQENKNEHKVKADGKTASAGRTLLLENGRPVSSKRKREFSGSDNARKPTSPFEIDKLLKDGFPQKFLDRNNFGQLTNAPVGNKSDNDTATVKRHRLTIPSIVLTKMGKQGFSISKGHQDYNGFSSDSEDDFTSDFVYKRGVDEFCIDTMSSYLNTVSSQDVKQLDPQTDWQNSNRSINIVPKRTDKDQLKLCSKEKASCTPDSKRFKSETSILQIPRVLQLRSDWSHTNQNNSLPKKSYGSSKPDGFKGISINVDWNDVGENRKVLELPVDRKSKKRSRHNSANNCSETTKNKSSDSQSSVMSPDYSSSSSSLDNGSTSRAVRKRARHRSDQSSGSCSSSGESRSTHSVKSVLSASSNSRSSIRSGSGSDSSCSSSESCRRVKSVILTSSSSSRSGSGSDSSSSSSVSSGSRSSSSSSKSSGSGYDTSDSFGSSSSSDSRSSLSSWNSRRGTSATNAISTSSKVMHKSNSRMRNHSSDSDLQRGSIVTKNPHKHSSLDPDKSSKMRKDLNASKSRSSKRHHSGSEKSSKSSSNKNIECCKKEKSDEKPGLSVYGTLRTGAIPYARNSNSSSSETDSEGKGVRELLTKIKNYHREVKMFKDDGEFSDSEESKISENETEKCIDESPKRSIHAKPPQIQSNIKTDCARGSKICKDRSLRWCNEFLEKYKSMASLGHKSSINVISCNNNPVMVEKETVRVDQDPEDKASIPDASQEQKKYSGSSESSAGAQIEFGKSFSYYVQTSSESESEERELNTKGLTYEGNTNTLRSPDLPWNVRPNNGDSKDNEKTNYSYQKMSTEEKYNKRKESSIEEEVFEREVQCEVKRNSPRRRLDIKRAEIISGRQYCKTKDILEDIDSTLPRTKLCSYSSSENELESTEDHTTSNDVHVKSVKDTDVKSTVNDKTSTISKQRQVRRYNFYQYSDSETENEVSVGVYEESKLTGNDEVQLDGTSASGSITDVKNNKLFHKNEDGNVLDSLKLKEDEIFHDEKTENLENTLSDIQSGLRETDLNCAHSKDIIEKDNSSKQLEQFKLTDKDITADTAGSCDQRNGKSENSLTGLQYNSTKVNQDKDNLEIRQRNKIIKFGNFKECKQSVISSASCRCSAKLPSIECLACAVRQRDMVDHFIEYQENTDELVTNQVKSSKDQDSSDICKIENTGLMEQERGILSKVNEATDMDEEQKTLTSSGLQTSENHEKSISISDYKVNSIIPEINHELNKSSVSCFKVNGNVVLKDDESCPIIDNSGSAENVTCGKKVKPIEYFNDKTDSDVDVGEEKACSSLKSAVNSEIDTVHNAKDRLKTEVTDTKDTAEFEVDTKSVSPELTVSSELMEFISQKRTALEEDFAKDCQVFVSVCQFLLSKNPSLLHPLQECMQKCLEDLSDNFTLTFQDFIHSTFQANKQTSTESPGEETPQENKQTITDI